MQRNFPVLQNKHVVPLLEKELTDKIIGAAIEVHKMLGPGLLESDIKCAWNMRVHCGTFSLNIWWICH